MTFPSVKRVSATAPRTHAASSHLGFAARPRHTSLSTHGMVEAVPYCCGMPMLRATGTTLECAEAFMTLAQAGAAALDPVTGQMSLSASATAAQRELFEHMLDKHVSLA